MGYYPDEHGQFAGAGGQPHGSKLAAYLSHFNPWGQYTYGGNVYSSERAYMKAKWKDGIVDESKWPR